MYTDFNHFFTVKTRNWWHIKVILCRPPHLYSVTALPCKMHTTANVDSRHNKVHVISTSNLAHVWYIDVNGPSATTIDCILFALAADNSGKSRACLLLPLWLIGSLYCRCVMYVYTKWHIVCLGQRLDIVVAALYIVTFCWHLVWNVLWGECSGVFSGGNLHSAEAILMHYTIHNK